MILQLFAEYLSTCHIENLWTSIKTFSITRRKTLTFPILCLDKWESRVFIQTNPYLFDLMPTDNNKTFTFKLDIRRRFLYSYSQASEIFVCKNLQPKLFKTIETRFVWNKLTALQTSIYILQSIPLLRSQNLNWVYFHFFFTLNRILSST